MEFQGIFPDNKRVGYHYIAVNGEINKRLVEALQEHHLDTSTRVSLLGQGIFGHKFFDVFLENGATGELEANSYTVIYIEQEKRGVER